MTKRTTKKTKTTRLKPTVVGTGLVALDVVVNATKGGDAQHFAGGTCGNVLTALSYLGWNAKPISRLKNDTAADWLVDDMLQWGVDTELITRTDDGSTPVIIQNIKQAANGTRTHSFSLRCPCCSAYLPGYKPILGKVANEIADDLPNHQVYFFDRVSRGTLNLAQASADRGALIVFEPSGIGEPRLFREAWSIAHVIKYSNDRLRDIADLDLQQSKNAQLILEIETLGASGLRYRSKLDSASTRGWKTLKVIPVKSLKDAAGSGDWCTAGIVHRLARGGIKSFRKVSKDRLFEALRYGQALATWNCGFESARGGMYHVTKAQFERQVRSLLSGKSIRTLKEEPSVPADNLSQLCPTCEAVDFSSRRRSKSAS